MREKIDSYLGFAARSRSLVNGYNTCISAMNKGKIKLLIIASDLSENSAKKILGEAAKHKVENRVYGEVDALSQITGNRNVGIFGVTDKNFATIILKEIDENQSIEKEVF